MRAFRWAAFAAFGFALATAGAQQPPSQQPYPGRPIRIIVPFPAGGATDIMARNLSQKLAESWAQPVVVENRAGSGGIVGADVVAKAPADGYTVLTATIAHAANVSLFPKAPYELQKDLKAVAILGLIPLVPVVRTESPIRSMQELVAAAREKKLNAGSSGNGSAAHLTLELFKRTAGIDIQHVPYKGGAPAMTDLLGGQIDVIFALLPECLPHIRAGKLRPLAVTSAKRYPLLAEVPTMAEAGFSGMEVTSWNGFMVPSGTPREVVAILNAEVNRITASPEMSRRIIDQGFMPAAMDIAQAERFIAEDVARWARVTREAGIKAD